MDYFKKLNVNNIYISFLIIILLVIIVIIFNINKWFIYNYDEFIKTETNTFIEDILKVKKEFVKKKISFKDKIIYFNTNEGKMICGKDTIKYEKVKGFNAYKKIKKGTCSFFKNAGINIDTTAYAFTKEYIDSLQNKIGLKDNIDYSIEPNKFPNQITDSNAYFSIIYNTVVGKEQALTYFEDKKLKILNRNDFKFINKDINNLKTDSLFIKIITDKFKNKQDSVFNFKEIPDSILGIKNVDFIYYNRRTDNLYFPDKKIIKIKVDKYKPKELFPSNNKYFIILKEYFDINSNKKFANKKLDEDTIAKYKDSILSIIPKISFEKIIITKGKSLNHNIINNTINFMLSQNDNPYGFIIYKKQLVSLKHYISDLQEKSDKELLYINDINIQKSINELFLLHKNKVNNFDSQNRKIKRIVAFVLFMFLAFINLGVIIALFIYKERAKRIEALIKFYNKIETTENNSEENKLSFFIDFLKFILGRGNNNYLIVEKGTNNEAGFEIFNNQTLELIEEKTNSPKKANKKNTKNSKEQKGNAFIKNKYLFIFRNVNKLENQFFAYIKKTTIKEEEAESKDNFEDIIENILCFIYKDEKCDSNLGNIDITDDKKIKEIKEFVDFYLKIEAEIKLKNKNKQKIENIIKIINTKYNLSGIKQLELDNESILHNIFDKKNKREIINNLIDILKEEYKKVNKKEYEIKLYEYHDDLIKHEELFNNLYKNLIVKFKETAFNNKKETYIKEKASSNFISKIEKIKETVKNKDDIFDLSLNLYQFAITIFPTNNVEETKKVEAELNKNKKIKDTINKIDVKVPKNASHINKLEMELSNYTNSLEIINELIDITNNENSTKINIKDFKNRLFYSVYTRYFFNNLKRYKENNKILSITDFKKDINELKGLNYNFLEVKKSENVDIDDIVANYEYFSNLWHNNFIGEEYRRFFDNYLKDFKRRMDNQKRGDDNFMPIIETILESYIHFYYYFKFSSNNSLEENKLNYFLLKHNYDFKNDDLKGKLKDFALYDVNESDNFSNNMYKLLEQFGITEFKAIIGRYIIMPWDKNKKDE